MLPTRWRSNPQPPDHQSYAHPTWPPKPATVTKSERTIRSGENGTEILLWNDQNLCLFATHLSYVCGIKSVTECIIYYASESSDLLCDHSTLFYAKIIYKYRQDITYTSLRRVCIKAISVCYRPLPRGGLLNMC